MAYVDQDGLIMIDEVEASEDIKKLKSALEALNDVLDIINNISSINGGFKGNTALTIESATLELVKQVNNQKQGIEDSISLINSLLEKYKTLDSNLKNIIQN